MNAAALLAAIALVPLVSSPPERVVMDVISSGNAVGRATITTQMLENGGKRVSVRTELGTGAQAVAHFIETTYASDGMPTRRLVTRLGPGTLQRSWLMRFGESSLELTTGAEPTSVEVPYPASKSLRAISEFWIVRDRPRQGDTARFVSYDPDSSTWNESVVRYIGEQPIRWNQTTVRAHLITVNGDRAWIDSRALPFRIERPGMSLERRP